jgi:hypothetical protein
MKQRLFKPNSRAFVPNPCALIATLREIKINVDALA